MGHHQQRELASQQGKQSHVLEKRKQSPCFVEEGGMEGTVEEGLKQMNEDEKFSCENEKGGTLGF